MPKIKNILIFTVIAVILILIYIFFIKTPPETATLISSPSDSPLRNTAVSDSNSSITEGFLTLLLNVKNIKLNDVIFSNNAFRSLRDSSITLTPDGNEGRPNPFAPLGNDLTH